MVRRPQQYERWLKRQQIGKKPTRRTEMDVGQIYVFGYRPEKREKNFAPEDALPLFIVTRYLNGGVFGINLLRVPSRLMKERILSMVDEANLQMDKKKTEGMLIALHRKLSSTPMLKGAVRFYRGSLIEGRIVMVDRDQLDDLVKRVL